MIGDCRYIIFLLSVCRFFLPSSFIFLPAAPCGAKICRAVIFSSVLFIYWLCLPYFLSSRLGLSSLSRKNLKTAHLQSHPKLPMLSVTTCFWIFLRVKYQKSRIIGRMKTKTYRLSPGRTWKIFMRHIQTDGRLFWSTPIFLLPTWNIATLTRPIWEAPI